MNHDLWKLSASELRPATYPSTPSPGSGAHDDATSGAGEISGRAGTRAAAATSRGDDPHHLCLGDAVQPEMAALPARQVQGVDARLVAVHEDRLDADLPRGLHVVAIHVDDAQRLLLEPRPLERGADLVLANLFSFDRAV